MRVLHLFKTYLPETVGGIESVILQICQSGIAQGIHSEVLTLSSTPCAEPVQIADHKVHLVKRDLNLASTGLSYRLIPKFKELAKQFDLIHYHFPWPMMDLLHFAAATGKPSVVSYHSDIVQQKYLLKLYRPLMHRFLDSVDYIVTASPNYLATSEVLQRYKQKTAVIPYGLDKTAYPQPSPDTLQKWEQRFGKRFFLFVGVMRYYKGLHVLLEAARDSDYPIVIVGAGPLEQELKEQARQLNLSHVHFLGRVDEEDKAALLQLCSTVVFPSHLRSEAFGISLLEGAMYGKPMISCEIGTGTSYINLHEQTGLVVERDNPQAFRAAMDRLWNEPELAQAMGQRAEERYWQVFTAQRMGEQIAELYQQVIESHANAKRA
ncbi:glycosyltransferase family 4 protein [Pseudomonas sp. TTU2014-080ASC]|uniref:glycosyltransferase family 4 protein n=1 Tax=Pseudomonas sp. TTU2014-080ASC TaxID=1729724 RepID=UPI00071848DA|nr:glycosyltransferase family 4 protein [Pseudomonas sp. TTU2014-080ASC]KRW60865.1 glycosyl transferase family 1 [Pseudomonas sp. TTU2014-080ASC]